MLQNARMELPTPGWEPLTTGYWLAAGQGHLVIQKCGDCGKHRWPPAWACYACQSMEWSWDAVPGTGTVFSYTWADQRPAPDSPLYDIAAIELDGTWGEPVRVLTRVIDVDKDSLRVGLEVEVAFEAFDDQISVPLFRPRAT